MKILLIILVILAVLFVLTFTIYFFNLDMKLIYRVQKLLNKHYDTMEKDRKL